MFTYNNGVKCNEPMAKDRLLIKRHEPLQECIFEEIVLGLPAGAIFVNLGCHWGYYCHLARLLGFKGRIIGYDKSVIHLEEAEFICRLNKTSVEFICLKVRELTGACDLLLMDIQGDEIEVLTNGIQATHVLVGTHDNLGTCASLLTKQGYVIKFACAKIPLQPDGLIWARRG